MIKPTGFTLPAILTGIAVLVAAEPAHAATPIPEPATLTLLGVARPPVGAVA